MPRIARGLASGKIYHIIKTAQKYDIVSTINPRGRPKKEIENE